MLLFSLNVTFYFGFYTLTKWWNNRACDDMSVQESERTSDRVSENLKTMRISPQIHTYQYSAINTVSHIGNKHRNLGINRYMRWRPKRLRKVHLCCWFYFSVLRSVVRFRQLYSVVCSKAYIFSYIFRFVVVVLSLLFFSYSSFALCFIFFFNTGVWHTKNTRKKKVYSFGTYRVCTFLGCNKVQKWQNFALFVCTNA